jgi:glycosyltransferase involved in cell wall biosynthesis
MRQHWGALNGIHHVLGTSARLVADKGIEPLIEAVGLLRRRGLPVVLMVAGTGPEQERMTSIVRRCNVSQYVRFLGFVDDMPAFYSGLDVFALCSATESFGLVLSEAMACQCPVVATPTAGALQQIRDGDNGRLLKGFSGCELADVLENMVHAPDVRAAMGNAGRETVVRRFNIDRALDRTLRLLQPRHRRMKAYPRLDATTDAALSRTPGALG